MLIYILLLGRYWDLKIDRMAKRGTSKWFSQLHEEFIARVYGGRSSPSSGGVVTDLGDVRTSDCLYECKHTGTFSKPAKSISLKLDHLEKIADEARAEGRSPAMCLRLYAPDSILSDYDGFVDITARLTADDLRRHD